MANEKRLPETKPFGQPLFLCLCGSEGEQKVLFCERVSKKFYFSLKQAY